MASLEADVAQSYLTSVTCTPPGEAGTAPAGATWSADSNGASGGSGATLTAADYLRVLAVSAPLVKKDGASAAGNGKIVLPLWLFLLAGVALGAAAGISLLGIDILPLVWHLTASVCGFLFDWSAWLLMSPVRCLPWPWSLLVSVAMAGALAAAYRFSRELYVYLTAAQILGRYQWLKWRLRFRPQSSAQTDAAWEALHSRNASLVLARIRRLRGFWVKVGQYLSSRTDVLPPEWTSALASLQDELPPDDVRIIRELVAAELGPVDVLFSSFEATPLASASIAQVHCATLRANSQKVVVKVQHAGIDLLMRRDFYALGKVSAWVARIDPDFDMRQGSDVLAAARPPAINKWHTLIFSICHFFCAYYHHFIVQLLPHGWS
jgi:hypothetical protein